MIDILKAIAGILKLMLDFWYFSIPFIFFLYVFTSAVLFTDDQGDSVFSEVHKARKAVAKKQKEERDAWLLEESKRIQEEEKIKKRLLKEQKEREIEEELQRMIKEEEGKKWYQIF